MKKLTKAQFDAKYAKPDDRRLTEEEYYHLMCGMDPKAPFEENHRRWLWCFAWILRHYKVGYRWQTIQSLFYNFEMDNWLAMHQDETEYKGFTKLKLLKEFAGDCSYICDRASYDRLLRAHWLFRKAYDKELSRVRFSTLYDNEWK